MVMPRLLLLALAAGSVAGESWDALHTADFRTPLWDASPDAPLDGSPKMGNLLQRIVDYLALRYNTSYSISMVGPRYTWTRQAGVEDHATGANLTARGRIPVGSATKPFVAVALLRLAAEKKLALKDTLAEHVDPWLAKHLHGSTLASLYGPAVGNATIAQVMGMRSGINDWDDDAFKRLTFSGAPDYEPAGIIKDANHTLDCAPGTCATYSSVGYVLLGLVLCAVADTPWNELDLLSLAVPDALRGDFNDTIFVNGGKCSAARGVTHQYAAWRNDTTKEFGFFDIFDDSCLNAWTAGNLATTTLDLARFWDHLFKTRLTTADRLAEMKAFAPLTSGWMEGLEYGLGIMASTWKDTAGAFVPEGLMVLGHGGEDYGSSTFLNGFVPYLNASFVLATTSDWGTNCSLTMTENANANHDGACVAYNAILQAVSSKFPKLDCTSANENPTRRLAAAPPTNYTCRGLGPAPHYD